FDVNTISNDNAYFYVGGNWEQSVLPGAIMIRPQVGGDYSKYTGISQLSAKEELQIAPNPAHDNIRILNNLPAGAEAEIFSITGQFISRNLLQNNILSITDLQTGMYLLKVIDVSSGTTWITKFIKQ
ncbi:MAG: T9SS type A sorting domain-containing protein, partial [Chitinophagales bacterium]|nr:T9SS type A sorting domain-containing protein [Chitinophagales bacterium]